jgi:hypothetical protein
MWEWAMLSQKTWVSRGQYEQQVKKGFSEEISEKLGKDAGDMSSFECWSGEIPGSHPRRVGPLPHDAPRNPTPGGGEGGRGKELNFHVRSLSNRSGCTLFFFCQRQRLRMV